MTNEKQKGTIEFSPIFNKKLANSPTAIKRVFRETLELFRDAPNHPSLRDHSLTNKYAGLHSIDVTGDWRALYRNEQGRIIFVDLGTHDRLYG